MEIVVDYGRCMGHGQCLLAAPDLFDLEGSAGQVTVLDTSPEESTRQTVVRAASMCPARAIAVVD